MFQIAASSGWPFVSPCGHHNKSWIPHRPWFLQSAERIFKWHFDIAKREVFLIPRTQEFTCPKRLPLRIAYARNFDDCWRQSEWENDCKFPSTGKCRTEGKNFRATGFLVKEKHEGVADYQKCTENIACEITVNKKLQIKLKWCILELYFIMHFNKYLFNSTKIGQWYTTALSNYFFSSKLDTHISSSTRIVSTNVSYTQVTANVQKFLTKFSPISSNVFL